MKHIFLVLLTFLISCSTQEKEKSEETLMVDVDPIAIEPVPIQKEKTFEETQDSLRQILWNSKPNLFLKSSLLEELYLRGMVDQTANNIVFNLSFDLHGLDCGAPDCYETDISFSIPTSDSLTFPKKLKFKLMEHGCVDKELNTIGQFELVESSSTFFNYYCEILSSNLVYVKKDNQLYYFTGKKSSELKVSQIEELLNNYVEEDSNEKYPYQSTTMNSSEYEPFLGQE